MQAVRFAVLALLRDGPSYPYELTQRFNRRVGVGWQLNRAAINQALGRLEREGLVRRAGTKPTAAVMGRSVLYELTEAGGHELDAWMSGNSERVPPFRDELIVKIALAKEDEIQYLLDSIDRQRRLCEEDLTRHSAYRSKLAPSEQTNGLGHLSEFVLVDGLTRSLESEIGWLKDSHARIQRFQKRSKRRQRGRPRRKRSAA